MLIIQTLKTYIAALALANILITSAAALEPDTPLDILLDECRTKPSDADLPLFDETLKNITQNSLFKTEKMETIFRTAARNGHNHFVQQLLNRGVPVDARSKYSETALHLSAQSGHDSVITILLNASAKVDARDRWQRTALEYAIDRCYPETTKLLVDHLNKNKDLALLDAISRANIESAKQLLLQNADPNILDPQARSCLFMALNYVVADSCRSSCLGTCRKPVLHDTTRTIKNMITIAELLISHGALPLTTRETNTLRHSFSSAYKRTDPLEPVKHIIEKAQQPEDYAKALLDSHNARDNSNPVLEFLPHDIATHTVEYALTRTVYQKYEQRKRIRKIVANATPNSDDESESNDEKDSKEPIAPEK